MPPFRPTSPAAQFHLLGQVELDVCLALQRRLVYEAGNGDAPLTIILCEHPEAITVGRSGSRGHIRLSPDELARRRFDVRYLGRGGGCVLHGPGQLAIYPIVPLAQRGWTVGGYLRRLQSGLAAALAELRVPTTERPGRFGLWGRSGQLAAVGVVVQANVAWQGAFLNVSPQSQALGYVDTDPDAAREGGKTAMGSMVSETGRRVTMPMVRSAVVPHLASALECDRHHLHTGHPLVAAVAEHVCRSSVRAG